MKVRFKSYLLAGSLALFVPLLAQSAALTVNGTCEIGSCAAVDSLNFGQSVGPTAFSFNYTTGADMYNLSGNYSASFDATGTNLMFNVNAIYIGSAASTANDVIKVDLLQNFFAPGPGSWDGTYTETVPISFTGNLGAGSTVSAQVFWGGQGVGLIGPLAPGTYNVSKSADLTGLTANTLTSDYNFTFDFAAGTLPGGGVVSAVPEPAQVLPVAMGLLAVGFGAFRRRVRVKA